ncbi:hypothetical protein [Streptomyces sp. NPDC047315]|uniref:hypothetical protein n=1 Tax=Streptomyces sp. NPDC047315 TaxID=3155142 RepID=UPI0034093DD9
MTEASVCRRRRPLRALAVTAVALGAVLAPAGAAFADEKPKPSPERAKDVKCLPIKTEGGSTAKAKPTDKADACVIFRGDSKSAEVPRIVLPRGGVAAGERPEVTEGAASGAGVGVAAGVGALVLVGGGVLVRRRGTARATAA